MILLMLNAAHNNNNSHFVTLFSRENPGESVLNVSR